ncbi:uncharacterized protein [Battus philenor]|uniref:uncharacterized protein n=1 Tax=Battus philenor TaxID=42288 RepID=UPI0035D0C217
MDVITDLMQNINIQDFDIGSSTWVDITHINNPHSFYVRPTTYRKYLPVLHASGQRIAAAEVRLQMNIVYKSKTLKCYCRGQIVYVNEDNDSLTCDIFAVDHGFLEKNILLRRIYHPFYKVNLPPLAFHCQLADCKSLSDVWSSDSVDAMKFFIGEERAKLVIRGKSYDKLVVELRNSCPDDIATMLALTEYTILGYDNNVINREPSLELDKQYYTFKELQIGDTLHVRLQSGKNLNSFYVALIDDYNDYIKEVENLSIYSKKQCSLRLEDMTVNKPISVYAPDLERYERGIIKTVSVSDEKAKVKLVDWGTIIEANVAQMKPLLPIYLAKAVTAIYCSAEQSEVWSNSLQKYLCPAYEFVITVKEIGSQFNTPYIVNISPIKDKK